MAWLPARRPCCALQGAMKHNSDSIILALYPLAADEPAPVAPCAMSPDLLSLAGDQRPPGADEEAAAPDVSTVEEENFQL